MQQSFSCFVVASTKCIINAMDLKIFTNTNMWLSEQKPGIYICTNYTYSENSTFLSLCLWWTSSVNFISFLTNLQISDKNFVEIVRVDFKLKFKKLDKFYVQICPIFARPVTYVIKSGSVWRIFNVNALVLTSTSECNCNNYNLVIVITNLTKT